MESSSVRCKLFLTLETPTTTLCLALKPPFLDTVVSDTVPACPLAFTPHTMPKSMGTGPETMFLKQSWSWMVNPDPGRAHSFSHSSTELNFAVKCAGVHVSSPSLKTFLVKVEKWRVLYKYFEPL